MKMINMVIIRWYDSNKDYNNDIMTSVFLKQGNTKGVCDAIKMQRKSRKEK